MTSFDCQQIKIENFFADNNHFADKKNYETSKDLKNTYIDNIPVKNYLTANKAENPEKRKRKWKHSNELENSNDSSEKHFVPQKRKKSSEKERQRNLEIKAALGRLGRSVPFVKKDLSRIRTLRLAKEYIKHLKRILQGDTTLCEFTGRERPLSMSDFERVVHREMQTNNSYKERAECELTSSSSQMSYEGGCSPSETPKPIVQTASQTLYSPFSTQRQDSFEYFTGEEENQQRRNFYSTQLFHNRDTRFAASGAMLQVCPPSYGYIYYPTHTL